MKKSRPRFHQSSPSLGGSITVVTNTLSRLAGQASAWLSKAARSHLLVSELIVLIALTFIVVLEVLR
tara:strand:- start:10963 stop:11163 length:201 start_codon:yes stop_codon:yes gene_type:complete